MKQPMFLVFYKRKKRTVLSLFINVFTSNPSCFDKQKRSEKYIYISFEFFFIYVYCVMGGGRESQYLKIITRNGEIY